LSVGKEVAAQLSLPVLASKFRIDLITNSKFQVTVPLGTAAASASDLLSFLPPSSSTDTADKWTQDPKTSATVSQWTVEELVDVLTARAGDKEFPSVMVDCTSDNSIAAQYPALLQAGVHIVTPNKKAFSGSQSLYDEILSAKKAYKALVYQESTVGAGLPVIGPLKDLVDTGDEIYKAEGVVSGTFSYVFNEFSKPSDKTPAPKFSEVVKIAQEAGFTEPNPADDLNGSDVARKLCILARLIGSSSLPSLPEGFASVPTESLVPKELESVTDGKEFMKRLPEFDDYFEKLRAEAYAEGNVLRYVGLVDVKAGKLKAGLEKYPFAHPFAASLSGSDCILSFLTKRYPSPLIIQGAGAGSAVTAMGCVADLLKIHERVVQ